MVDLRTPRKIKSDKLKNDVMLRFKEIENYAGSDWQKCEAVAQKLKITPSYVAKIIKAYRNESKSTNEQSS